MCGDALQLEGANAHTKRGQKADVSKRPPRSSTAAFFSLLLVFESTLALTTIVGGRRDEKRKQQKNSERHRRRFARFVRTRLQNAARRRFLFLLLHSELSAAVRMADAEIDEFALLGDDIVEPTNIEEIDEEALLGSDGGGSQVRGGRLEYFDLGYAFALLGRRTTFDLGDDNNRGERATRL